MATKTRTRSTAAKSAASARASVAKAKGGKAGAPATKKEPVERVARGRDPQSVKNTPVILKRLAAGEKLANVARDLGITPGMAAWLVILHRVDTGDVSTLAYKTDAQLVALVKAERAKGGEFSAWHWIAARTGVAEGKIKAIAESEGIEMTNIATVRAAANPKPKATAKAKTTTKGRGTKASKTRTRRSADPS